MTKNKIVIIGILAILSFVIAGCSNIPWVRTVQIKNKSTIFYAKGDVIYKYKNGKISKLFNNPAGYDSLDNWLCYSEKLNSIVLLRGFPNKLTLIKNINGGGNPKYENLNYVEPDLVDYDSYSLFGEELYQIRSQYNKVELWKCSKLKKWNRVKSLIIPKDIPVPKNWMSQPEFIKDDVIFETPSGYFVKANKKTDDVKIISNGDPNWAKKDGNNEAFIYTNSNMHMPSLSKNGKYIVSRPLGVGDGDIRVVSIDGKYKKDYKAVNGFAATVYWLDNRYILCEEYTALSGLSRIYIVDTKNNTSDCILTGVERGQWCVAK